MRKQVNPINQEYPWDQGPYMIIKRAIFGEKESVVFFENGDAARFKNLDITPRQFLNRLNWPAAHLNEDDNDFTIPTYDGANLTLSWLAVRLATDEKFADYWDTKADEIEKGD